MFHFAYLYIIVIFPFIYCLFIHLFTYSFLFCLFIQSFIHLNSIVHSSLMFRFFLLLIMLIKSFFVRDCAGERLWVLKRRYMSPGWMNQEYRIVWICNLQFIHPIILQNSCWGGATISVVYGCGTLFLCGTLFPCNPANVRRKLTPCNLVPRPFQTDFTRPGGR